MLDCEQFEQVRRQITASGPGSTGDNLLGMEMDCCAFLSNGPSAGGNSGLWQGMTVRRSEGADWLITGRAEGHFQEASAIAGLLVEIWTTRLRYRFQSAHTVLGTSERVQFRAVTQAGPGEMWVTAAIDVTLT